MPAQIEGGCRCGRVRYRIAGESLPNAYACHCRDCQTWSGSAFSLQIVVPESALEVSGEPGLFELTTENRVSRQRACPVCFTRVYNTNSARPGLAVIRAGTLDRSDELKIVAHIWTSRKLADIPLPPGTPHWEKSAPPQELGALLYPKG